MFKHRLHELPVLLVLLRIRLAIAHHVHTIPLAVTHIESNTDPFAIIINGPDERSIGMVDSKSHVSANLFSHTATNALANDHPFAITDDPPDARSDSNNRVYHRTGVA